MYEKLPPSGGDTQLTEAQHKAQGWDVSPQGIVTIPQATIPEGTFSLFQHIIVPKLFAGGAALIDSVNSAIVSNEIVNVSGEWGEMNSEDGKFGSIVKKAAETGDFANLTQNMNQAYDQWVNNYGKKRGAFRTSLVQSNLQQYGAELVSMSYTAQTGIAKRVAKNNLEIWKQSKLLEARSDPWQAASIIEGLYAEADNFALGNVGRQNAQIDLDRTVHSIAVDAIAEAALRDPYNATDVLESMRSFISPQEYLRNQKQIQSLQKTAQQELSEAEAIEMSIVRTSEMAQSTDYKPVTKQVKDDADIFDAVWEPTKDKQSMKESLKADTFISIGYIPPSYINRLYNYLSEGSPEEVEKAVGNINKIQNKINPMAANNLPQDLVAYAARLSDLAGLDNQGDAWQKARDTINTWNQKSPGEQLQINKNVQKWTFDEKNKDGKTQLELIKEGLFQEEGRFWGYNSRPKLAATDLFPDEAARFTTEIAKAMEAFNITGMSRDGARRATINQLNKRWGLSYAAGTKAYATYMPIENLFAEEEYAQLQTNIMKQIGGKKTVKGMDLPKAQNIRLRFFQPSPDDSNNAIYQVYYRDTEFNFWLQYRYMEGEVPMALFIDTKSLRPQEGK